MLTRLPRRHRRGFARRCSTQVDLNPEKLQLAELHNDGSGNKGRMYATTVVHSKVLDMDITVHLPVLRKGIHPLQRMTSAGRAKKLADCRALVDAIRRPGAAVMPTGHPMIKNGVRCDAWEVTPEAMELSKKVMWGSEEEGYTGFMFIEGNVRDPKRVKKAAKLLYDYLFAPDAKAVTMAENMLRDLLADADEHGVPREKVTPELIRLAWLGRHVPQPDDLESFLFRDRAVVATAPMPEMVRKPSMATAFTAEEVDGFGGATSFILERLHEMGTSSGCKMNWGGDDGEVPDAPPALQNSIWSELWFHSSNMWHAQQR